MTQDNWNKAREQRDKLLEHYNKVIKPTLLDFYNITGEDITLMLDDSIYNTTLIFRDGNRLEYVTSQYHIDSSRPSTLNIIPYTLEYPDTSYINLDSYYIQPNIKVIKVFNQHWDKIRAHLDTRIGKVVSEYSSLVLDKKE